MRGDSMYYSEIYGSILQPHEVSFLNWWDLQEMGIDVLPYQEYEFSKA